ncbi:hypothetical protein KM043_015535 [Ampulex compressa]|nr:hypothetical protein KM043_015535 [Ampulex compressa]
MEQQMGPSDDPEGKEGFRGKHAPAPRTLLQDASRYSSTSRPGIPLPVEEKREGKKREIDCFAIRVCRESPSAD